MRLMAILAAAVGASQLFALPAQAATYGFVSGEEVGTFTTGAASPIEPGYFLLTDFDFSTLYSGGPLVSNVNFLYFYNDAAFDPVTDLFINGSVGNEYSDNGGFATNFVGPDHQGSNIFVDPFQVGDDLSVTQESTYALYQGPFEVTSGLPSPSLVPEPGTWALIIAGMGCVGLMRRSQRKSLGLQPAA